ncbi:cytochrome c oxidase subunit III family protein [Neorickettsia helminthoeca str. Oregon]|uniref:cytochrome-c oxidase n=1 Tax=Neorickettsia helminthoeca str. Oregon TaxID=1286528 RepID=X5HKK2_9RICK|nr:cytochrome c oxidase subunit 3 [Neorickettsia helminthoeca]AHX11574.1 cytochrome c oxidase subunit III family protein [Neorickettsia helminthoeca str. Oregon]
MSKTSFHILDPSPWPIFTSAASCGVVTSAAFLMRSSPYSGLSFFSFLFLLLLCLFCWWRDVVSEGIVDKAHNPLVRRGLRIGMILLIFSEVMFFFAFFWSLFKAWLDPAYVMDGPWPTTRLTWPGEGITVLNPWNIPFLNTMILLLSGATMTWAHYSVLKSDNKSVVRGLLYTMLLGLVFTCLQGYEYYHATFSLSEEGYKAIYSSNFYLATGFHGLHVIIGTIFIAVCLFRAKAGQFTPENHLGLEFATWYWHFVDVVWLFLFTILYWLSTVI